MDFLDRLSFHNSEELPDGSWHTAKVGQILLNGNSVVSVSILSLVMFVHPPSLCLEDGDPWKMHLQMMKVFHNT